MIDVDVIRTLHDDDHVEAEESSSSSDEETQVVKKKSKQKAEEFSDSFFFSEKDQHFEQWGSDFALRYARKRKTEASTLEQKIERARLKRKLGGDEENMEVDKETSESEDDDNIEDVLRTKERKVQRRNKRSLAAQEDTEEKLNFTEEIEADDSVELSFHDMGLSRPLLKALSTMGFNDPTPIQAATIPVAMKGKDVCACAATGTGKTAAYLLPVLERLLYRPKGGRVTRVLIMAPTRELAVQIHSMARLLARHIKVNIALAAGGLDLKSQEDALRQNPDIVVATPGRLIDHLHNSVNFNLRSVEVLVLDEADRMLDDNFADQMKELIELCSPRRQMLLLSATMTEHVKDLATVSLRNPIKVFVNENTQLAWNLRQEFIRIRPNREGDREAIVTALVKRNFTSQCLVFIQTKVQVHRMHLILGLLGVNAAELSGDLSQAERLEALEAFKRGTVDVLLATELASRGLDIENVQTVINFTMPQSLQRYIHRVGRTARAGRSGRSISLVGEKERKMLKDIVKNSRIPVKSRIVAPEVIIKYAADIAAIEDDIVDIMKQEEEDHHLIDAEKKIKKAEKLLAPKEEKEEEEERSWFQNRDKQMSKSKRKKMEKKKLMTMKAPKTPEERVEYELMQAAAQSARHSKKQQNFKKIRTHGNDVGGMKKKKKKNSNKSSFEQDLTGVSGKALKKLRAGPLSQQEKREKRKQQMNKKKR